MIERGDLGRGIRRGRDSVEEGGDQDFVCDLVDGHDLVSRVFIGGFMLVFSIFIIYVGVEGFNLSFVKRLLVVVVGGFLLFLAGIWWYRMVIVLFVRWLGKRNKR